MKVALYKNLIHDFVSVIEFSETFDKHDEYLRISECLDVEFTMLDPNGLVNKQIDVIDKKIKTIQAESEKAINDLIGQKNELLALPNQE